MILFDLFTLSRDWTSIPSQCPLSWTQWQRHHSTPQNTIAQCVGLRLIITVSSVDRGFARWNAKRRTRTPDASNSLRDPPSFTWQLSPSYTQRRSKADISFLLSFSFLFSFFLFFFLFSFLFSFFLFFFPFFFSFFLFSFLFLIDFVDQLSFGGCPSLWCLASSANIAMVWLSLAYRSKKAERWEKKKKRKKKKKSLNRRSTNLIHPGFLVHDHGLLRLLPFNSVLPSLLLALLLL